MIHQSLQIRTIRPIQKPLIGFKVLLETHLCELLKGGLRTLLPDFFEKTGRAYSNIQTVDRIKS
ncbi:hypothetical protein HYE16_01575 [Mycoplasmopsis bovis]|nr:hypothetical protein HYE16_01575 [Mycoplasmopsis bovis]